uniref:Secreted protein n=2 Tax=Cacopsylla melanoneura TaxID=428564 RepID=A0A8D8TBH1_9HEMI
MIRLYIIFIAVAGQGTPSSTHPPYAVMGSVTKQLALIFINMCDKDGNNGKCWDFTANDAREMCGNTFVDISSTPGQGQVYTFDRLIGNNTCYGDRCHVEVAMSAARWHAGLDCDSKQQWDPNIKRQCTCTIYMQI